MNYTTQYDKQLLNQFEHLHRHPQLLPFIGAEWNDSRHKLLLVAESHYLPEKYNYQIGYSEWNDLSYLKSLDDNKIFDWTNTRKNVEGVVEKWGHRMHNGLSRSLINVFNYNSKMEAYRNISYYNYFQRPAHEEGGSIKGYTTSDDDDLAFDFYKVIVNVLKPQWVIFLSKPAFESYRKKNGWHKEENVSRVAPPTSRYWNVETKEHDHRTSKEKFEEIIGKVF